MKTRQKFPVKSNRQQVRMEVIPEPAPGSGPPVLKQEKKDEPTFVGSGTTDYVCGGCGFAIARGVDAGQIQNLVLTCGACGKFNRVTSPATN